MQIQIKISPKRDLFNHQIKPLQWLFKKISMRGLFHVKQKQPIKIKSVLQKQEHEETLPPNSSIDDELFFKLVEELFVCFDSMFHVKPMVIA